MPYASNRSTQADLSMAAVEDLVDADCLGQFAASNNLDQSLLRQAKGHVRMPDLDISCAAFVKRAAIHL
jgi:hypothetical protein